MFRNASHETKEKMLQTQLRALAEEIAEQEGEDQGGMDSDEYEYQRAGAECEIDGVTNNLMYHIRTQLTMKPKRVTISVNVAISKTAFVLLFSSRGMRSRITRVHGERLHVKFEPPNSTELFADCIGKKCLASMRRFHGRDAQGNWSTTHVDCRKPITLVWNKKVRSNVTPVGIRVDERESMTVTFSMRTDPLDHNTIKNEMKAEERNDDVKEFLPDSGVKLIATLKQLGALRRRRIEELEKELSDANKKMRKLKKKLLKRGH